MKVMIRFGESWMLTNFAAGAAGIGLYRLVGSHAAKKPSLRWKTWKRVL